MRDGSHRSSTAVETTCTATPEKPLQLDKTRLVDVLCRMSGLSTAASMRRAVADLKAQLDRPNGPLLARPTDDIVNIPLGLLHGELDQISAARTIERGRYYVERLIRGITVVRTSPINDINLNRWKEYTEIVTDSLWYESQRDGSGVHSAQYWGNFIPQIPRQMMQRYTKRGEWVLDVFAGAGTTLIEGQRLGRNTIGIELQKRVVERARDFVANEDNRHNVTSKFVIADSATVNLKGVLKRHGQQSVQLAVLHPPYFDIIKFSDDDRDLSNAPSVEAFLDMMGRVVENVATVLDRGRYLVLVIGDKYSNGEWVPLGFMTMNEVLKRNFSLKSIIVKNFEETAGKRKQKELWKYRALAGGFYLFKHEYIFVFRKQR